MRIKGKGGWFTLNAPVPASVLREMARACSAEGGFEDLTQDRSFYEQVDWLIPWTKWLDLPIAFCWLNFSSDKSNRPQKLPMVVRKQLIGQKIAMGIRFTYKGKDCYVISNGFPAKCRLGDTITEEDLRHFIIEAVETKYIDMSA